MLAVLGLLGISALPLVVEGESQCPRPQEVSTRLLALAPARAAAGRAVLTREATRLRLRLHRPDGELVGERWLAAGHRCPELAEAAALVLASWLAELQPIEVAAPPPPPAAPARTPVIATPADPVQPAAAGGSTSYQLGLGFLASGARSPVAGLALDVVARRGDWGLALGGAATAWHQEPLGPAQIRWARRTLTATGRRRLIGRRVGLQAEVGLAGALTQARGSGYDVDHSSRAFDVGPVAGLQLELGAGPLVPYLGLTAVWWSRPRTLEVRPDPARLTLPQLDAWLVLGLAWRLGGVPALR